MMYIIVMAMAKTRFFSDFTCNKSLRRMAFFAAALFVSHPIQTQSVTYIVQRFESLATMFYLLSIIFYIKARTDTSARKFFYYITSLAITIVAMKTKEIAFTIPITALAVEFLFIEKKEKGRFTFIFPMLLLMLIIPLTIVNGDIFNLLNSHKIASSNISQYQYLITQFSVILTYFMLLFCPVDQCLDYDYPLSTSFFQIKVVLGLAVILVIIARAIYSYYRSKESEGPDKYYLRLFTFGTMWFFITISVQSGLVPLMDLIIEHRLYLPSIGFFIALLSIIEVIKIRKGTDKLFSVIRIEVLLAIVIVVLCITTIHRNRAWQTPFTLWEDVVKKHPNTARGRYNLGIEYSRTGRFDDAVIQYEKAITIKPGYVEAYHNMGLAFMNKGSLDKAIWCFVMAIGLNPQYADAYVAYGNVLLKQNKLAEAMENYKKALEITPSPEAVNGVGVVMGLRGDFKGAIEMFDKALSLKKDYKEAADNKQVALSLIKGNK
ncbi:MAG: tetratricopeptide repeat protein [Nitrospirae bacterium]|nr:tetratricopeptide repeat protein [Nitrospirota bacterium]